jgi:hypothetical protein
MDRFSECYQELIEWSYDSADRIVLNAYFPMGQEPGGMLVWWRNLYGGDETMDTAHLMRMAGRFSRRVRAFADSNGIPIIDCAPNVKKFQIAQTDLSKHDGKPGVFLILVAKSKAPVWEVERTTTGKVGAIRRKKPMPYVNHYSFHIWDAEWGHITIKMSGHPPFGAQIILNGHDYLSCAAKHAELTVTKQANCFVQTSDAAGLTKLADTLSEPETEGRLRQLCDRWIYSSCVIFGLDLEEQQRSGFQYRYSTYQLEYSRNFCFSSGRKMWEILQRLVDRTRSRLDLKVVKTIFGFKNRPRVKRLKQNKWGIEVETPTYDLTVFHVHYGKLSLKIYSKGEFILRIEVMVHNASDTPFRRSLVDFPKLVSWAKDVLERFLDALHCVDVCFISDEAMEKLPEPSIVGKTRVGGIDLNRPRMRLVVRAILSLSTSPTGFSAREVSSKVRSLGGLPEDEYGCRQAAYDLKKLRGKEWIRRKGNSRRYEAVAEGLRSMTALIVLRDDVIKPLLAAQGRLKPGRRPTRTAPIDAHYAALRSQMSKLFLDLGIAA